MMDWFGIVQRMSSGMWVYVCFGVLTASFFGESADRQDIDLSSAVLVKYKLTTTDHSGHIQDLSGEYGSMVDIWALRPNSHADIFMDASVLDDVTNVLNEHGIKVISNTTYSSFPKEVIASATKFGNNSMKRHRRSVPELDTSVYHTYDQIMNWLENNVVSSCGSLCEIFQAGSSHEGRPLKGVKIGVTQCGDKQKMFIDCGIHAREWVSPAVCVYIISQMINGYSTDNRITSMVDKYDWYILPVANPDGYVYSMTTERLWRKNRRNNPGSSCYGVDLNRNWGFAWGGQGASTNPCSNTYRGGSSFSEPEAEGIRAFVRAKSKWHSYLTYHSYGEYVLAVWGYTRSRAPNYSDMKNAGDAYNDGLNAVNSKSYFVGQSGRDLSVAAGGSDDWFYSSVAQGGAGCPYSYTMELRDEGQFGFVLPENQVLPTAQENFAGLKAYITYLETNGKLIETGGCSSSGSTTTIGTATTTTAAPTTIQPAPTTTCRLNRRGRCRGGGRWWG